MSKCITFTKSGKWGLQTIVLALPWGWARCRRSTVCRLARVPAAHPRERRTGPSRLRCSPLASPLHTYAGLLLHIGWYCTLALFLRLGVSNTEPFLSQNEWLTSLTPGILILQPLSFSTNYKIQIPYHKMDHFKVFSTVVCTIQTRLCSH